MEQVLPVQRELQEHKELLAQLEQMEILVLQEQQVRKELLVQLEQLELMVQ